MAKSSGVALEDLVKEGKLDAQAIDACVPKAEELSGTISTAQKPEHVAALAIVAGQRGLGSVTPELLALLKRDDVGGRAAAWALGRIDADVEKDLLAAIAGGGVSVRDNGYWALAIRAARGAGSPGLADAIAARIDEELARAKSGRVSLADRAIAVLSVLGDPRTEALARHILESDRSSDRVELHRILRRFETEKRDTELKRELTSPWTQLFKDQLYVPPAEEATPAPASPLAAATAQAMPKAAVPPPGPAAKAPPGKPAAAPPPPAAQPGQPAQPQPVDWAAFEKSPEAAALSPTARQFAPKVGGLLEQIAMRAVGVPLSELSGRELMAVLVQVLPQSLPQQHVELALSPEALDGYEAVMKFLARTGATTNGPELVSAVQQVRDVIEQQMTGPR